MLHNIDIILYMSIDKIPNELNSARVYKKGSKVDIVNYRPNFELCMLSEIMKILFMLKIVEITFPFLL